MENECTLHISIIVAICVPKIIEVGIDCFFETRCRLAAYRNNNCQRACKWFIGQ